MPNAMATNDTRQRLVCVELNEVNFDLVRKYLAQLELPNFRKLLSTFETVETFAEQNYEELEPWIQWVSAHSGRTYDQHRVFRLGDGANSEIPQIYEMLEQRGLSVGAISPMNSRNAMSKPAYFVPDPWTHTQSDGSGFSRRLTAMLRQTVNENSQGKISRTSILTLIEATVRAFSFRGTAALIKLIARTKGRHWYKALVLDQLIHLVHLYQIRRTQPDVSFVFLNAGAHIQHHYYFNSPFCKTEARNPAWYIAAEVDPILDMLKAYDTMLGDYLTMTERGWRLIVATGLTQLPYDRIKFYYRLKVHEDFLRCIGISFTQVQPRMTRDFEVFFSNEQQAAAAAHTLSTMRMARDGIHLFAAIENRGVSLFVTLTYPSEIFKDDFALYEGGTLPDIFSQVSFVAIKNGMHSTKGFAFVSPGSVRQVPKEPVHVSSLFHLTLEAAGRTSPQST